MTATKENAVLARQQLRVLAHSLPDAVAAEHRDRIADLTAFLAACEGRLPTARNVRRNLRRKVRRNGDA